MAELRKVPHWLSTCADVLDALVFPWSCSLCDASGLASPFCPDCREELKDASGRSCGRCAMPIGPWARNDGGCDECRGRSLGFDAAIALAPYQGPVRALCLQLKGEAGAWLARWLIDLLMEVKGEALAGERASCVVPVPLHWKKRWSRRYNQAEALATRLARRLDLVLRQPLKRVVSTPHLVGKTRTERIHLLRGAFVARRDSAIEGKTVLLVDDILTTGSTCGAAARALKQAGARRVVAVVIGRAEGRS